MTALPVIFYTVLMRPLPTRLAYLLFSISLSYASGITARKPLCPPRPPIARDPNHQSSFTISYPLQDLHKTYPLSRSFFPSCRCRASHHLAAGSLFSSWKCSSHVYSVLSTWVSTASFLDQIVHTPIKRIKSSKALLDRLSPLFHRSTYLISSSTTALLPSP